MKFPKNLKICGKDITIKYKDKITSSSFDATEHTIEIRTNQKVEDMFEDLIHETLEYVLYMNNVRLSVDYDEVDFSDFRFMFNHNEFCIIAREMSNVVQQIMEVKSGNKHR